MNRTATPITITTLSVAINARTADMRAARAAMAVGTEGSFDRLQQARVEHATLIAARSELRASRRTQSGSPAADRTVIAAAGPILEADELAKRMTDEQVRQGLETLDDLTVDDEQAQAVIEGTRYTQADAAERDQAADFAAALATADPLMHLHGLGYDCSTARVRTVGARASA